MREILEFAALHTVAVASTTFGCGFVLGWFYAFLQWGSLHHSSRPREDKDV